jgi:hypothetical protein
MSIIEGKYTEPSEQFARLKLVATLATMIYADPQSTVNIATAVDRAREVLKLASRSLDDESDLRVWEKI